MGLAINSPLWRAPHDLYRLFDASGNLLYIGIAADVADRFRHHAREKEWWSEVASHTLERHVNRRVALAVESAAIAREQPRYNVQYGPQSSRTFASAGGPR